MQNYLASSPESSIYMMQEELQFRFSCEIQGYIPSVFFLYGIILGGNFLNRPKLHIKECFLRIFHASGTAFYIHSLSTIFALY